MNVLTRETDRLVLNGFTAIKDSAVIKYGDGLMIIDSRPYKKLKDQFEVHVNKDRTITDKNAMIVADILLERKHTLFIEAEHLYYIQDVNFEMSDEWETEQ